MSILNNQSIPAELKEKLLAQINPEPAPPTYLEEYEAQRWNPEAWSKDQLIEYQSQGWFHGYEYDQKKFDSYRQRLNEAAERSMTPEELHRDTERRKMITQVVGTKWRFDDESLDQYKQRRYGIEPPIQGTAGVSTRNIQDTQQPRESGRRESR